MSKTPKKGIFDGSKMSEPLTVSPDVTSLKNKSLEELLALQQQILELLPPTHLTAIDLEKEIVMQYHRAKALLALVVNDALTPANQKAQVANSCAAALEALLKMQTRLYSAERMKAIEQALIKAVKTLPTEAQEQFFRDYETIYQTAQEQE